MSSDANQPETSLRWKLARRVWRIARPLLIAYLVILLAMMFLETWLVYPAPPVEAGDWNPKSFKYEDVWFTSADGTKLHGWFIPNAGAKQAILYCHGNGEDVAAVGDFAAFLGDRMHASVFVFDYRGYGHSEGRPAEAGCIADGDASQHWLAEKMAIQPKDVVLMGRSLGGAVAIALAGQNGARALVLENAFSTMHDVAAWHYPWLPVRLVMQNRYDNIGRIQDYHGPLMQTHGTEDEIVPLSYARRLFDAAPSSTKRWLELPGLGHNNPMPLSYYDQLAAFLSELKSPAP
jgi:fermentation-respiration switch protein FrsA (DUF1100 family)